MSDEFVDPLKQSFEGKRFTDLLKENFKSGMKTFGQATAKSSDDTLSFLDAIDRMTFIGSTRGGIMDLLANKAGVDSSYLTRPFQNVY